MIFPKLTFETVLQVDEKTRLDASLSFATDSDVIADVLIKPHSDADFISVYNNNNKDRWFIDWAYEDDELVSPEVRLVTEDQTKTKIYTSGITVLSQEQDALLSDDNDLLPFETDILKYLPKGKNSFIYAHRKSQERILAYLDEQRIWRNDGSRYTKQDIVDLPSEFKDQFKQWSCFQTLTIIFESLQRSNNDIFQEKKMEYEKLMISARNRASLRLDQNGDGNLDPIPYNIRTTRLVRR